MLLYVTSVFKSALAAAVCHLFSLCHHRCLGVLDTGGFEFPTIDGGRKPLVGSLNPFPFSLDYQILTFRDLLQV